MATAMNTSDWTLLTVTIEGEPLEIEGADVWMQEWRRLDIGSIDVPHPSYRHQSHTLWPFAVEHRGQPVIFCAGELSNGVWCFHVPANEQPSRKFKGMTVNERLYESGLLEEFDVAIKTRIEKRAKDILIATGLNSHQANETVEAILRDPKAYGFGTDLG